jgi:hypothetical protein
MKRALIFMGALLAIGASGFGAYGALQADASGASPDAIRANALARNAAQNQLSDGLGLAAGVRELALGEGLSLTALERVAATAQGEHPAGVFAATKGTSTCAYLTGGRGAVGGCMQLGTELLEPRIAVVDGGTYVWGLAKPSVTSIDARTDGQTFHGSVTNGAFAIEIPDGSHGTGPIDLAVTSNGSTTTIGLPGVPTPLP